MKRVIAVGLAAIVIAVPGAVLGWGSSGHRMIGQAAMRALPAALPAFLRTPQAVTDVGEYSREPDRLKRAGRAFDSDRDQGHFLDLGDDGTVFGGPKVTALPATRADYEKALQAVGQDSWKAGYLPYSILEAYQELTQDFAYWRVEKFAESNPAWAEHKAWFAADRARREGQILTAIGNLSHFVGDGSQPLHVTVHFNGWGDFPNPNNYAQAKLHAAFEGDLVKATVKLSDVEAQMAPPRSFAGPPEQRIGAYLAATGSQVIPLYEMEKAGGMQPGDPRGTAFATRQIAVGAAELRDMIVLAWQASDRQSVGWRPVPVADVLAGKIDPYQALSGVD
ncbi:S1/P1 Nuclease [Phenylobacterium sp.]|uniref:S1/P1 Nuclease n=1 Tax=Phenylobacterium sp. TaxID=1871053 RepID=UPI003563A982